MQISVDERYPGYCPCLCPYVRVYLDGVERSGTICADEEKGTLRCYEYDIDTGAPLVRDDKWVEVELRGEVRIDMSAVPQASRDMRSMGCCMSIPMVLDTCVHTIINDE